MDTMNTTNHPLATPRHRIASIAVDIGFYIITLGIGWFIWSLVMWAQGQTPGKQILKIRVMSTKTGKPANWGRMLLRQVVVAGSFSFGWVCILDTYVYLSGQQDGGTFSNTTVGICVLISGLISLALIIIDLVWFFQKDHRRLLDYLSGTYVVNESVVNVSHDFQANSVENPPLEDNN
jgi:hypothetical protein